MDGHNGWYAGQQPPSQQPLQPRLQPPHVGPGSNAPFNPYAPSAPAYQQVGSPDRLSQPMHMSQSAAHHSPAYAYKSDVNMDGPSSLAGSSFSYGQAQTQHQQPSPYPPSHQQQLQQGHQYGSAFPQPTASSSGSGARHPSNAAWEYAVNSSPPVQSRPSASAPTPHKHQHGIPQLLSSPSNHSNAQPFPQISAMQQHLAYDSPYAASSAGRHRASVSESPVSDVFPRGPSTGKTFDLMAGLEPPSPASPTRRPSHQNATINSMHNANGYYEGNHGEWPASSLPEDQARTSADPKLGASAPFPCSGFGPNPTSTMQHATVPPYAQSPADPHSAAAHQFSQQWPPAHQNARSQPHASRPSAHAAGPGQSPNVTSWNSPPGAYFNVPPAGEPTRAAAQSRPQSFAANR